MRVRFLCASFIKISMSIWYVGHAIYIYHLFRVCDVNDFTLYIYFILAIHLNAHENQINNFHSLYSLVEALRKYPPGATIVRSVTKDYQVPGTNYTLAKKTMILLPVYAIHHDAEFYPEPEKFIPERFELDEVQKRPSCTFLPFGEGMSNGSLTFRITLSK